MVATQTLAFQNPVCAQRGVLRWWLRSSCTLCFSAMGSDKRWLSFSRILKALWSHGWEWMDLGEEYWSWTVSHRNGSGVSLQVVLHRDMTHFGIISCELRVTRNKWDKVKSSHLCQLYLTLHAVLRGFILILKVMDSPGRSLWEFRLVNRVSISVGRELGSSNFLLHQGEEQKCMHCGSPN